MLPRGAMRVPALAWSAERDKTMTDETTKTPPVAAAPDAKERLSHRRVGYTFQEYFTDQEDGDVWVQNVTDMQISLDIETAPGQTEGHLIPPSPDPENLTEKYSFEVLKKSSNFRKTLAKRTNGTPNLVLLSIAQADAYYQAKARQLGAVYPDGTPNVDAALDAAEKTRRELTTRQAEGDEINASNLHGFAPPKSAQELIALNLSNQGVHAGNHAFGQHAMTPEQHSAALQQRYAEQGVPTNMQGAPVYVEEVINPKVMHLCQQVNPQVPESARMPAASFFSALQTMQANLQLADYQYIESHGTFRTVKKWARQKIADVSGATAGLPDNLSLEGHQQVATASQQGALEVLHMPQGPGPQGPAAMPGAANAQYQGPTGFANTSSPQMGSAAQSMAGTLIGPDGLPLGG